MIELTEDLLVEVLAAHPQGDIPFSTIHLGPEWQSAISAPEYLGMDAYIVPWRDGREVYLTSGAGYGFHTEEVSLAPGKIRRVEEILKSGSVTVVPSGAALQWWSMAGLAFTADDLETEFCGLIGDGHEHGQLELRNGIGIRMHDWELTIHEFETTNTRKDVASLVQDYYQMPVSLSNIESAIRSKEKDVSELKERKKMYK